MDTKFLVYWSLLDDVLGVQNWSYSYFKWDFLSNQSFVYDLKFGVSYEIHDTSVKQIFKRELKPFNGFDLVDDILNKYGNKKGIPKRVLEYHLDWFISSYYMDSDWELVSKWVKPCNDEIYLMYYREFFRINFIFDFLLTFKSMNPIYIFIAYYIRMFFCFIDDSTMEVGFMEAGLMFNDFQEYYYFFESYEAILWMQFLSWGIFLGIWLDIGYYYRFKTYINKASYKYNKGYKRVKNPWNLKINGKYFMIKEPMWMVPVPIKELDRDSKKKFIRVYITFLFVFIFVHILVYWYLTMGYLVYYGERIQPWFIDNDEEGWLWEFSLSYEDLETKKVRDIKRLKKAERENIGISDKKDKKENLYKLRGKL